MLGVLHPPCLSCPIGVYIYCTRETPLNRVIRDIQFEKEGIHRWHWLTCKKRKKDQKARGGFTYPPGLLDYCVILPFPFLIWPQFPIWGFHWNPSTLVGCHSCH